MREKWCENTTGDSTVIEVGRRRNGGGGMGRGGQESGKMEKVAGAGIKGNVM